MRTIPASELIINDDGSIFHLHLHPGQLADTVILVGDPGRVALVAGFFDTKECEVANREFKTVTGTYKGKRMTVLSTGMRRCASKRSGATSTTSASSRMRWTSLRSTN